MYNKVQLVAYEANVSPKKGQSVGPTLKEDPLALFDEMLPFWSTRTEYRGLPNDKYDSSLRVSLLKKAIAKALTSKKLDKSALKIFIAPEFYFRGSKGAYDFDVYSKIVDECRAIAAKVQHAGWLFVFGTTVVKFLGDVKDTKNEGDTTIVNNVALIQLGGQNNDGGAHEARCVVKDLMSEGDFLTYKANRFRFDNGSYLLDGDEYEEGYDELEPKPGVLRYESVKHMKSDPQGPGKEQQIVNYGGEGIFDEAGITFGVEVCIDHFGGRLKVSQPKQNQNKIQVQLVTAAGLPLGLRPHSVVAIKNGYAFLCDGKGESQAAKVTQAHNGDKAKTAPVEPIDSLPVHDEELNDQYKLCFAGKQATIRVYPSCVIPKQPNS